MRFPFLPAIMAGSCMVILSACGGGGSQGAGGMGGQGQAARVTVAAVEQQAVTVAADVQGRTRPFAISEVRPQVTGLIVERLFEEGETVEEGAPLYRIDDSEYRAAAEAAEAALARARANAEVAAQTAERLSGLVDIQAVSRQRADEARASAAQARADVAQAQASLTQARINLERTTIAAPIAGKIGRSSVTPGALVTANQAASLATIRQVDPLYVDLTASSSDLLRWRRAMAAGELAANENQEVPVTLTLEDGTVYEPPARLAFSEVSVDETAGTVTLRAIAPNPDGLLLPGMFVRASVPVGERANALIVPQPAVQRTPRGEPFALVVGPDGTAQQRPLEIEGTRGGNWIVSSGLEPGDQVIVTGLQMLQPGMPVAIVDGAQAAPATTSAAR